MRGAAFLLLPVLLAACEGRQAVSICAAVGDPAGEVVAAFHDAGGLRSVLVSDAGAGRGLVLRDTVEPPILTDLWRLAETTMRALPEVEASPCGLDTLSAVRVTFADGSVVTRVTSCSGNALSRVAGGVLAASDPARAEEVGTVDTRGPVASILDACDRLS